MTRQTIKEALRALNITQAELARACGLSEATISRQLSGDLPLSPHVQQEAEELLVRRVAQASARLSAWVQGRLPVSRRGSVERDASPMAPATAAGLDDAECRGHASS